MPDRKNTQSKGNSNTMKSLGHQKKQLLKTLIFLSGFVFLSLQIWQTFQTFIEKRSTFEVSKESFDNLVPPTIVLCLLQQWDNNLNEKITISMIKRNYEPGSLPTKIWNLTLGENYDDQNELMLTVSELINPFGGLCYILVFNENHKMNKMGTTNASPAIYFYIKFALGMEIPKIEVSLVSSEDNYGFIFPQVGRYLRPSIIPLEAGKYVRLDIKTLAWKYLLSKRNCKYYSSGADTYPKCMVKKNIECALNRSCKCIPERKYKTYFELYPALRNSCKTNEEKQFCIRAMQECYHQVKNSDQCPLSCEKISYDVQKRVMDYSYNGKMAKIPSNQMDVRITYSTTDIEIRNEVLIQELGNFIGTVGGSLGLFIGFSYTGFVGQIIDYFVRDD